MGAEYERRKDKYDQILFRVRKGKSEEYKQAAQDFGIGFWELIQNGIEEYIQNHGGEMPATSPKPESISAADKRLVEEFSKLPVDAQKHFLKAFRAINSARETNSDANAATADDDKSN